MRKSVGLLLLLALPTLVSLSGCYAVHYSANADKPVLPGRSVGRPHKITQHFEDRDRIVYLFWGLAPVAGQDGTELIRKYLEGGDGIVNLAATERFTPVHYLTWLLTAGLVSTRQVLVEGDVFIYTDQPAAPTAGGPVGTTP